MKTVVLDPVPPEFSQLIEHRRVLGLDGYDEIWEGVYHMAPMARFGRGQLQAQLLEVAGPLARKAGLVTSGPFNLGKPDDFRVPDGGLHRGKPDPQAIYLNTAAAVIEIASPGDETYDKLGFYGAHDVAEVLVLEPGKRQIQIYALAGDHRDTTAASGLLGVTAGDIAAAIGWP